MYWADTGVGPYNVGVTPRLYVPDAAAGATVRLSDDEARHVRQVLRLVTGSGIRVFDGRGSEFEARLVVVGKDGVSAQVGEPVDAATEPRTRITLAAAVLKQDAMDALVRDAAMIGVAGLQPIVTARTNLSIGTLVRRHADERWRRIAVASVKQSGRAVVPDVRPPVDFTTWLAASSVAETTVRLLLIEPGAGLKTARRLCDLRGQAAPSSALVATGPEGGWTPAEVSAGEAAGFVPVTLGSRTLRADAVPIVALTLLMGVWGDFD